MSSCRRAALAAVPVTVLALSGCAVGPNYHRPSAPVPQRFKEADGWKPAEPREAASGTNWWSVYDDATLDGLEKQIDVSNQTLKASEATWRQAMAVVSQARAGLFPTIGVSASGSRSGGPGGKSGAVATSGGGGLLTVPTSHPVNEFDLSGTASWDIDIWGKIRRTIQSDVASAQASEADLAAARLSLQAMLATDYLELRVADEQRQLLEQTVEAYKRALQITQNQYQVGVVAKTDVITAETQLEGAQSQQINVGVTRATLEHAIAMLTGKPPADFSLPPATLGAAVPVVPTGVPSSLLERRPDVAEAERKMAAANAQIGVAVAAYFPDLTLNGSYGYASTVVSHLVSAPNNLWAFGGTATDALLDFGARSAVVRQVRAAYDAAVANYRQTVLTAFQQVEDELATLRILEQQVQVQEQAVKSANLAVQLTLNQYKAGTVAYTAVITAQAIALADAQTLLTLRQNRMTASVALIQALGGGWDAATLGTPSGTAAGLTARGAPH
ncbi:MAG TPA: efflux transporter outer membrane subunit [Steroidobacteraceae bacterium]|jgi:NodT family efflux transporter outer membrane factor (OMF) lipoprotein|nr:efflux transporter outer membrane subunit [Steroidobacteraceae bacterium]